VEGFNSLRSVSAPGLGEYEGPLVPCEGPPVVVQVLLELRVRGYQFFGVQAERFQWDPDIRELEEALHRFICVEPLPVEAYRQRQELEGWASVFFPEPDPDGLSKVELVNRVDTLLFNVEDLVLGGLPRIWPSLAKDPALRARLQAVYGAPGRA
jgi:hypothetical protein